MKHNKLWRTFVAVSISALALPAFVQSQTSMGGSSTRGAGGSPSATGTMGVEESPGAAGSSQRGESSRSSGSSGMNATEQSSSSAISDQAKTEEDRTLNQKIRQELASDSDVNTSTSNVHFNTNNGKVTLQGTVATEQEKQNIEDKVKGMNGVKEVDNQLQLASTSSSSTRGMGSHRSSESGEMGSSSGRVTR